MTYPYTSQPHPEINLGHSGTRVDKCSVARGAITDFDTPHLGPQKPQTDAQRMAGARRVIQTQEQNAGSILTIEDIMSTSPDKTLQK